MAKLSIIKDLAKQKNLTLDYVAKESGITSQGLYKMMRENSTKVDTLEKIAEVLGVPVSRFFGENDNMPEKVRPLTGEGDMLSADAPASTGSGDRSVIERLLSQLEEKDRQIAALIELLKK